MSRLSVGAVADVRFGGLEGLSLAGLNHGFVVVSGRNEAGKSTLAEFIAWMIAGPSGNTANALRYGDAGSVVGGRLVGVIGDDNLEVEASFTILGNGAPSDNPTKGQQAPRRGTLGAVSIDGAQLLVRLGGLTPAAYSLLYRIGSETAHLLDMEDDLVGLFARYATGTISSTVDPRAVIEKLRSDVREKKTSLNSLAGNNGRRAEVRRMLDEALARPGRIRDIEAEIVLLGEQRTSVGEAVSAAAEKLGDLRAAVGVFGRDEEARLAERALADAPDLPSDVAPIAADLDTVVDLAEKVGLIHDEVKTSEPEVTSACRAVGVDAVTLAGHSLTSADKQGFRDAASALVGKQREMDRAEGDLADHRENLRVARENADTAVSQGALDRAVLMTRILDVDKVSELGNPAYAVDQAVREVGRCERALEAARREAGPGTTEDGGSGGDRTWRRVLPSLLAVLAAFAGAYKNPIVSALAGTGGLVLGTLIARSRRGSAAAPTRTASDPVAAAAADLEKARLDVSAKLSVLNAALSSLGLPAVGAAGALAHVSDLQRALDALGHSRQLEVLTEGLEDAVRRCATGVSVAETTYNRLFEQRGLPKVAETGIETWLDVYADAIKKAAAYAELIAQCGELEAGLSQKTDGVARLSDGSSPSVIADRAREFISVREGRAELAREASRLRNEANIAMGGRDEVRQLLQSGNKEMLEAEARSVDSSIRALEDERSGIDGRLGALRTELGEKLEGELVADLTEELGRIDDDIEELVREYVVLAAALESIETVVGEYELRNQGPVIDEAQKLIASVDPDFGALYIDRSTGAPRLMVDRSGRRVLVQRLSTGARALVYFALRLAFQTVDAQGRPVSLPLICDDPLVTVDDRRVEPLMRLLQKVSEERQVIFLTCHDRETTIATRIGAQVITMR